MILKSSAIFYKKPIANVSNIWALISYFFNEKRESQSQSLLSLFDDEFDRKNIFKYIKKQGKALETSL